MDQLISKYLNNTLTKEETQKLESWLRQDVKNRIEFENIVAHLSHQDGELATIKEQVFSRVVNQKDQNIKLNFNQKLRYITRVAAVFVVVFGVALYLVLNDESIDRSNEVSQQQLINQIEKETAFGQQLSFKLPDGTMVKLNAGSKLVFPKQFSQERREVSLIGEAFFDVERDETRPFLIKTNKINVSVLGTSFNVRSYGNEANVLVGVKTGRVMVSTEDGKEEVILAQRDLADYSLATHKITKEVIEENALVFGWMDRELILKDYNIDRIMDEVSRWFDVQFDVRSSLDKKRKFTTRYKDPTLKSVMESLSYAYEFDYQIDNKTITIMTRK